MRRWITWIGSLLMALSGLAYGAKAVLPMKTDGTWFATVLGTFAAGGVLTAGAQFRSVKRTVGLSVMPEIEALQQADLNAVNHLVERFAGKAIAGDVNAKAAVELCRTLFTRHLFDLHYLTPPSDQPVPPVATSPSGDALAEALKLLNSFTGSKVPPVVPVTPPQA